MTFCAPLCNRCILQRLRIADPVPGIHRDRPFAGVVVDYPSEDDIEEGRLLTGRGGAIFQRALDDIGVSRAHLNIVSALACRPRNGSMKYVDAQHRIAHRAQVTAGVPENERLLPPIEACSPRFMSEIMATPNVMAAGSIALQALSGDKMPPVDSVHGNILDLVCRDGINRRVVPVMAPTRALVQRKWLRPMRTAMSRAFRWFSNQLKWDEPKIKYNPPVAWIRDVLIPQIMSMPWVACDTETDAIESCIANLRMIQFAGISWAVVICTRSREGKIYYTDEEIKQIHDLMATWLPQMPLIGHNLGYYDYQVVQRNYQVNPRVLADTLIIHRYIDPDLPHTLGFVGAEYSDVHAWKADKTATADEDGDMALMRYGALDAVVNARVFDILLNRARMQSRVVYTQTAPAMRPDPTLLPRETIPGQDTRLYSFDPVLTHDHAMQRVCVEMHQIGLRIDQEAVARHEADLTAKLLKALIDLQAVIKELGLPLESGFDKGRPLFNPNSTAHMKMLLYGLWDLPFPDYLPKRSQFTDAGERAAGDILLRAYMCDMSLSREQHAVIHLCRRAKKMGKLLGSYIHKLRPYDPTIDPNKLLAVWPDGRLRVNWNATGTGVGRLSCGGKPSRTSVQVIPGKLKDCYVPAPGNVFVGADLAAIHLVIIAQLWNIPSLVEEFRSAHPDPHASLARIINPNFDSLPGHPSDENNFEWQGPAKRDRNTAKSLRYAGAYKAAVPTIHATMTRTEDSDGNLTNRTLTQAAVQAYYDRWMGAEPEWRRAWDRELDMFRAHGYMCSPILGRRSDIPDGDPSAIINARILKTEGDIMGTATIRVRNRYPPGTGGPNTGIVAQIHDQLVLEVPEKDALWVRDMLVEEMSRTPRGWHVPVRTDGKIGTDLSFKIDPFRRRET